MVRGLEPLLHRLAHLVEHMLHLAIPMPRQLLQLHDVAHSPILQDRQHHSIRQIDRSVLLGRWRVQIVALKLLFEGQWRSRERVVGVLSFQGQQIVRCRLFQHVLLDDLERLVCVLLFVLENALASCMPLIAEILVESLSQFHQILQALNRLDWLGHALLHYLLVLVL